MSPRQKDKEAYAFLRSGSNDTAFLRENGISIIYTRVSSGAENINFYSGEGNTNYSSDNPDLVELTENVYLLKEGKQEQLD